MQTSPNLAFSVGISCYKSLLKLAEDPKNTSILVPDSATFELVERIFLGIAFLPLGATVEHLDLSL